MLALKPRGGQKARVTLKKRGKGLTPERGELQVTEERRLRPVLLVRLVGGNAEVAASGRTPYAAQWDASVASPMAFMTAS